MFHFPKWSRDILERAEPLQIDAQEDRHVYQAAGNNLVGKLSYLQREYQGRDKEDYNFGERNMFVSKGNNIGNGPSQQSLTMRRTILMGGR